MQTKALPPALVLRAIGRDRLAVRLMNIGRRQRFDTILQCLRADSPLLVYEEIEHESWWIGSLSQSKEVVDFARRNGLRLLIKHL